MLKLKQLLLNTGRVIDNQYLDEYIELILNNINTTEEKNITQKHHCIPVFCYLEEEVNIPHDTNKRRKLATKLADSDSNNYQINLKYSDHIKAHLLLSRCGKTYKFILSNIKACLLMLRLIHIAVTDNVVSDLDSEQNIQTAYSYLNTLRSDKFHNNSERTKALTAAGLLGAKATSKKVKCVDTGVVYDSLRAAEIANGLTKHRLNQILTGRRKQIPGMTFEYVEETDNDNNSRDITSN
jgi:hypothetical protein